MPKRTILLLLLLTGIVSLLVYAAIKLENSPSPAKELEEKINPAPKTTIKDAEVFFVPADLDMTVSTKSASFLMTQTADIYINSHSNAVNGVQLELSYDPSIVTNVSVYSPNEVSFFGQQNEYNISFQDSDMKNGRISYAVQIDKDNIPRIGVGKVATITFRLNPDNIKKVDSSIISFVNKTMILRPNSRESVLEKTVPLTINFTKTEIKPTASPNTILKTAVPTFTPTPTSIQLQASPLPTLQVINKDPVLCIQVITSARNPVTNECHEFPTPCDVPAGWDRIDRISDC